MNKDKAAAELTIKKALESEYQKHKNTLSTHSVPSHPQRQLLLANTTHDT
tara:strand:- start:121 stop:270 length:150 start_codon:yes stop_codon:yes gene_type:complete